MINLAKSASVLSILFAILVSTQSLAASKEFPIRIKNYTKQSITIGIEIYKGEEVDNILKLKNNKGINYTLGGKDNKKDGFIYSCKGKDTQNCMNFTTLRSDEELTGTWTSENTPSPLGFGTKVGRISMINGAIGGVENSSYGLRVGVGVSTNAFMDIQERSLSNRVPPQRGLLYTTVGWYDPYKRDGKVVNPKRSMQFDIYPVTANNQTCKDAFLNHAVTYLVRNDNNHPINIEAKTAECALFKTQILAHGVVPLKAYYNNALRGTATMHFHIKTDNNQNSVKAAAYEGVVSHPFGVSIEDIDEKGTFKMSAKVLSTDINQTGDIVMYTPRLVELNIKAKK